MTAPRRALIFGMIAPDPSFPGESWFPVTAVFVMLTVALLASANPPPSPTPSSSESARLSVMVQLLIVTAELVLKNAPPPLVFATFCAMVEFRRVTVEDDADNPPPLAVVASLRSTEELITERVAPVAVMPAPVPDQFAVT